MPYKSNSPRRILSSLFEGIQQAFGQQGYDFESDVGPAFRTPVKTTLTKPDIVEINEKISDLVKQNHSLTRLQTKGCIDSAIFIERSNRNNQKIEEFRWKLRQLQEPDNITKTIEDTRLLLDLLEEAQPMVEFDPVIFKSMIQKIIVYPEKFGFCLINGLVLDEGRC